MPWKRADRRLFGWKAKLFLALYFLYFLDYIFLFIVLSVVGGIIYAVKGANVQDSITKQKEAMKVGAA